MRIAVMPLVSLTIADATMKRSLLIRCELDPEIAPQDKS